MNRRENAIPVHLVTLQGRVLACYGQLKLLPVKVIPKVIRKRETTRKI